MRFGYKLCSEERSGPELVRDAAGAEAAGFDLAGLSDHFHPWLDAQGESPFAWTVLGAIAGATSPIEVGTMVTCPTMRLHPAIVAQAAATVAELMPGRTFLGVGTGERLNEHVIGAGWPPPAVRREMLAESIGAIRALWRGDEVTVPGRHLRVETARLYSLPAELPPIYLAASGEESAELAAASAEGLITTAPDAEVIGVFRRGSDGPVVSELLLCWGMDEDEAMSTVRRCWPLPALEGDATTELARPAEFERAAAEADPALLRERVVTGRDPETVLRRVAAYREAGCTDVILHQIGTGQEAFLERAERELLPALRERFSDRSEARPRS